MNCTPDPLLSPRERLLKMDLLLRVPAGAGFRQRADSPHRFGLLVVHPSLGPWECRHWVIVCVQLHDHLRVSHPLQLHPSALGQPQVLGRTRPWRDALDDEDAVPSRSLRNELEQRVVVRKWQGNLCEGLARLGLAHDARRQVGKRPKIVGSPRARKRLLEGISAVRHSHAHRRRRAVLARSRTRFALHSCGERQRVQEGLECQRELARVWLFALIPPIVRVRPPAQLGPFVHRVSGERCLSLLRRCPAEHYCNTTLGFRRKVVSHAQFLQNPRLRELEHRHRGRRHLQQIHLCTLPQNVAPEAQYRHTRRYVLLH
mmetsp:Transcript_28064/g.95656  ORF Transcript_28064/g.95656 Transcript_28064/m.95656 type:complete len:316 (+) Transcript_28064:147-1094(+)